MHADTCLITVSSFPGPGFEYGSETNRCINCVHTTSLVPHFVSPAFFPTFPFLSLPSFLPLTPSSLSLFTAPSDVPPLTLTALTASSIEVRFRPPLTPNGIIISYTLTRFTPPTLTIIPLNTTTLPISDDYFIFTDINLLPFTNYTYTLTVCTNAGCTNSTTAQNTTLEDTPQGINAPTAIVTNSSTISLSWVPPTQPNGVIQGYDILRRDLGFVGSIGNTNVSNCCEEYIALLNLAGNDSVLLSESCSYVAETSPEVLSYIDTTLQAYSFYQYCIITFNNADSAHSELSTPTQTSPAPMPAVGPQLNASTINSTAIYLTWGSLDISELLGPLEGYTLYGRPAGGVGLGQVLFTGPEQLYTATDLIASTEYVFVVSRTNHVRPSAINC